MRILGGLLPSRSRASVSLESWSLASGSSKGFPDCSGRTLLDLQCNKSEVIGLSVLVRDALLCKVGAPCLRCTSSRQPISRFALASSMCAAASCRFLLIPCSFPFPLIIQKVSPDGPRRAVSLSSSSGGAIIALYWVIVNVNACMLGHIICCLAPSW